MQNFEKFLGLYAFRPILLFFEGQYKQDLNFRTRTLNGTQVIIPRPPVQILRLQ